MKKRSFKSWGLRPVGGLDALTSRRGCYLLLLRIPAARIRIGALGSLAFREGVYAYVGSAQGRTMTLAHRLGRHLTRVKRLRWHIDYLTSHPVVEPVGAYVSTGPRFTERRLACLCAQRFPVVPRFGNSDLRGKTPGHLFLLRPTGR